MFDFLFPLGLCTDAVDVPGSCSPILLRTGGVTECPQGGCHSHQMGALPMNSPPQHSWSPHGESRMPCRWTWIPGHLCLSPSRPHRAHLSLSLESVSSDFRTLGRKKHHLFSSTLTKQNPKPTSEAPKALNIPFKKNVYLVLVKNILPYLRRKETIK